MNDIEKKALALLDEVWADRGWNVTLDRFSRGSFAINEALCRAIEQHEAFRQEVSDEIVRLGCWPDTINLQRFIIAKPDPLVEIMAEVNDMNDAKAAEQLREALAQRGGKIVWEDEQ